MLVTPVGVGKTFPGAGDNMGEKNDLTNSKLKGKQFRTKKKFNKKISNFQNPTGKSPPALPLCDAS